MDTWKVQLRATLDNRFITVFIIALLIALLGGWLTYTTHIASGTTTEERTETLWKTTGEFDHAATAQTDSSVFSEGETLTDRPVYFTRVSPQLDGQFQTSYSGTASSNLTRRVSLSLVVREVDQRQQGDDATVYWQRDIPLRTTTVDSLGPEDPVRVPFSYNMSRLQNETDQITDRLGAAPGETEVFVRATVDSHGTVTDTAVNTTHTYTMPIVLNRNTYSIDDTDPTVESYETTETATVESTHGPIRSFGGPLVVVLSICVLAGLGVSRHQGRLGLSESERERLTDTETREEFDEWISPIELPQEAFDLPRAEATSLSALVDFAIDTNNSVVEDPDDGTCYVRHDGYLYSYQPSTHQQDQVDQQTDCETTATDGESSDESPTTETDTGAEDDQSFSEWLVRSDDDSEP